MEILLAAVGIACAAFCVWLVVRIANRRERWAKRMAVALVVLLAGYPLSIGPVFCLRIMIGDPQWAKDAYEFTYLPLLWALGQSPQSVVSAMDWYFELWARFVGES
jgi:RsiW-degrading membrane proteinase PrsW (M82 family)